MDNTRWVHTHGFDVMVAVVVKTGCFVKYAGHYACPVHGPNCLYAIKTEASEDRMLKEVENAISFHIKEVHRL